MTAVARLGVFAAALVAVFAVSFGVGSAFAPDDRTAPAQTDRTGP